MGGGEGRKKAVGMVFVNGNGKKQIEEIPLFQKEQCLYYAW